jgi:phosphoglycerate dehydrogenase-like enzyme
LRVVGFYGNTNEKECDIEEKMFEGTGIVCRIMRGEKELFESLPDFDALAFGNEGKVTEDVVARLSKCKLIVRQAIGYDNIDIEAARKRSIIVCNVPDYCVEEVADHAVSMILSLARNIPFYSDKVRRELIWNQDCFPLMTKMSDMTLGLVGFGKIPRLIVRRASPFFGRILTYDPFVDRDAAKTLNAVVVESLEELASLSDILSLHVPGGASTRHIIDRKILDRMKSSSYLVNTARGTLVNEVDLYDALRERRIFGAALDTLEQEPPSLENPLFSLDNVVFTPHAAWRSSKALVTLRVKVAEEILRVLVRGEAPLNRVN